MDTILPLKIESAHSVQHRLADRAKMLRLRANLGRRSLAQKSGVSEASIKRFENTGEISLANLLNLAFALDCHRQFDTLFEPPPPASIEDLTAPNRQRGRL